MYSARARETAWTNTRARERSLAKRERLHTRCDRRGFRLIDRHRGIARASYRKKSDENSVQVLCQLERRTENASHVIKHVYIVITKNVIFHNALTIQRELQNCMCVQILFYSDNWYERWRKSLTCRKNQLFPREIEYISYPAGRNDDRPRWKEFHGDDACNYRWARRTRNDSFDRIGNKTRSNSLRRYIELLLSSATSASTITFSSFHRGDPRTHYSRGIIRLFSNSFLSNVHQREMIENWKNIISFILIQSWWLMSADCSNGSELTLLLFPIKLIQESI